MEIIGACWAGILVGYVIARMMYKEEITRLREGNFTEEEFQNLCHNFSPDDEERFKQGCISYQKKLFNKNDPLDGCTML